MRWLQLGGETEEPIEARGPPRVNQSGHEPDELPRRSATMSENSTGGDRNISGLVLADRLD